ncbi:polysaccharide synthase [Amylocarpus encephaloides]|uniref:Polysaccharide synthase n=1 Tax=Amylocarpus encephaloides TaxID=45428 RepID=A0A9P7YDJ1_9HELO|nr:polysaccharide synthase [Amylocarpus encephaloides]
MAVALGALWAWDAYEKAVVSYYTKKYKTVPLPDEPTYGPNDVSIIVPTIDTESTFSECLRLWLRSKPREVIIVTVPRCKRQVEQLIQRLEGSTDKITILTSPVANKRQQLMIGAKFASGKIHALVDDDAYWPVDTVIPYLLAPFEDAEIGAVAGIQSAEISPERQDPKVITVWEAAAALDMFQMKGLQAMRFAADGGCWALVGRTLFVRAAILQDPHFINAFTHQIVGNRVENGADDVFVTEWTFDHGWKVCVQNSPESKITTDVKQDHKFAWQVLRWERGNIRSFLSRIFVYPGSRAMMRRHPYSTRKMIERLARPLWAFVYVTVWLKTLWTAPWLSIAYVVWMILGWGGWVSAYRAFLEEYPYCGRKIWALLLMGNIAPILDVYMYCTMNNDSWLTRAADAQDVDDQDVDSIEKIEDMSETPTKFTS